MDSHAISHHITCPVLFTVKGCGQTIQFQHPNHNKVRQSMITSLRMHAFGVKSQGGSPTRRPHRIVDSALKPKGPQQSGADELGLRTGDDVRHAKWGEGVILDLRGTGDKAEAVVRFPSVGEKTLLLAWAPLEKVG